jgi:hypothetical protein
MHYNQQVMQMIMQIGQMAQAVPAATRELQMAAQALTAARQKLIGLQQEPAPGMMPVGS